MATSSRWDVRRRAAENRWKMCAVARCQKHRQCVGQYCPNHQRKAKLYGHPLGRQIRKKETHSYVKMARRYLRVGAKHPAIREATNVMAALLPPAPAGSEHRLSPKFQLRRELLRLKQRGIAAEMALEAVCGIWLFAYFNPQQLPDDVRVTRALAHAVYRLAPLSQCMKYCQTRDRVMVVSRLPGALATETLGKKIRTSLGPFFTSLVEAVEADYERQQQKIRTSLEALRTPLTTTTTPATA